MWELSQEHLTSSEYGNSKLQSMELRVDLSQGRPWDVLRHLKQHFNDFSPQAGGSQLYLEFINTQKWSFLSGSKGVSQYTNMVSWLKPLSVLCFFSMQLINELTN